MRGARLGAVGRRGGRGGGDESAQLVDVGRHGPAITVAAATGAGAGAGAGEGGAEGSAAALAGPPLVLSLLNFERKEGERRRQVPDFQVFLFFFLSRVPDFQVDRVFPLRLSTPTGSAVRGSHAWAQLGRKIGPIQNSGRMLPLP